MLSDKEILATLEMVQNEHLDVRSVTLGVNIFDCASDLIDTFSENIYRKIIDLANDLVPVCNRIGAKYGIPIVNKRIAVSPIGVVGAPFNQEQMVAIAPGLFSSKISCQAIVFRNIVPKIITLEEWYIPDKYVMRLLW